MRGATTATAIALVALIAASTTAGVVGEVRADERATAQWQAAQARVTDADADFAAALTALGEARDDALGAHRAAVSATAIEPALFGGEAARERLSAALTALAVAAGIEGEGEAATLTEALPAAAGPAEQTAEQPAGEAAPAAPQTRAERLAAASALETLASAREARVDTLGAAASAVAQAAEGARTATLALVGAARETLAGAEAPADAAQEHKDAVAAAREGVAQVTDAAAAAPALRAYADAWAAAQASADEVARAKAAAAEAARRAAASQATPSAPSAPAAPGAPSTGIQPTYIGGVLIVNKSYPLPSTFGNGLTGETVAAFNAMQAEARAAGHELTIISGFRPYSSQLRLYNGYIASRGQAGADAISARPGHSEHQSGLAIDINSIDPAWGQTPAGTWVRENSARFGFVVRYPQGKQGVTGYSYEPWHLRYLGVGLAQSLTSAGLTLEEHFGIDSVYR